MPSAHLDLRRRGGDIEKEGQVFGLLGLQGGYAVRTENREDGCGVIAVAEFAVERLDKLPLHGLEHVADSAQQHLRI